MCIPYILEIENILDSLRQRIEIERQMGADSFLLHRADLLDENACNRKENPFSGLEKEVKRCNKCILSKTRKNVVVGEGNLSAEIIFLGEAPGGEEDIAGRPFVGRAGKLLTKIITAMGYRREEVYIANVLKCRPPSNRSPKPEEIAACIGFLKRQIHLIKPKVICALGKFANLALLNKDISINQIRGVPFLYEGINVVPTFHPAYLLRNPSAKKPAWQDFKKAMRIIRDESR